MVKAVVLGAAGGIGQPLSLLLKLSPLVDELALYDVVGAPGVAADLSHINTSAKVSGHLKSEGGLEKALKNADIVVCPAGLPRKPGMTRQDLFKINAGIVAELAEGIAQHCPKAFILIISNPVNSLVSVVANVLRQKNVFDPRRLFGVTTLDVVRASTFVAEHTGASEGPASFNIPVVGGHAGATIIPLLSQTSPSTKIDQEAIKALTQRIQFGGDEVVKAKDGAGSATLSMAQAGATFATMLMRAAFKNEKGLRACSFVHLCADESGKTIQKELKSDISVFAATVKLDSRGIDSIEPIGQISPFEEELLRAGLPELQSSIDQGLQFEAKQ